MSLYIREFWNFSGISYVRAYVIFLNTDEAPRAEKCVRHWIPWKALLRTPFNTVRGIVMIGSRRDHLFLTIGLQRDPQGEAIFVIHQRKKLNTLSARNPWISNLKINTEYYSGNSRKAPGGWGFFWASLIWKFRWGFSRVSTVVRILNRLTQNLKNKIWFFPN